MMEIERQEGTGVEKGAKRKRREKQGGREREGKGRERGAVGLKQPTEGSLCCQETWESFGRAYSYDH